MVFIKLLKMLNIDWLQTIVAIWILSCEVIYKFSCHVWAFALFHILIKRIQIFFEFV